MAVLVCFVMVGFGMATLGTAVLVRCVRFCHSSDWFGKAVEVR